MFRVSGPARTRAICGGPGLQKWTPNQGWSIDELDRRHAAGPADPDRPDPGHRDAAAVPGQVPADLQRDQVGRPGSTADGRSTRRWKRCSGRIRSAPPPTDVTATFGQPSADQLRADTATAGGDLLDTGDLRPEVIARATEVTAGATTAFDKADKLRNYFTDPANGFTYSLDVPTGDSGDLLVDFLNLKQGYCEQYASAMAVMLRAVGVPARVADRLHPGHPGRQRGLRDQQQRRARLGGGAVRPGRLGGVRPHPARRRSGRAAGLHGHRRPGHPRPPPAAPPARPRPRSSWARAGSPARRQRPGSPPRRSPATTDDGPVVPAGMWWALGDHRGAGRWARRARPCVRRRRRDPAAGRSRTPGDPRRPPPHGGRSRTWRSTTGSRWTRRNRPGRARIAWPRPHT